MYTIEFSSKAVKSLQKIPKKYQDKIITIVEELAHDPFLGKKLVGNLDGLFSFRVWPYRIVYQVYKKTLVVLVVDIAHRKDIYR